MKVETSEHLLRSGGPARWRLRGRSVGVDNYPEKVLVEHLATHQLRVLDRRCLGCRSKRTAGLPGRDLAPPVGHLLPQSISLP